MKKYWAEPELQVLNMQETFGGTQLNDDPDGDPWVDDDGIWQQPIGFDS